MSDETVTDVATPLRGTVGYEKILSHPAPRYGKDSASVYVQFDIPSDATQLESTIKEAFFRAKTACFEQVGVAFEYDAENDVLREVYVAPEPAAAPAAATAAAPAPTGAEPTACPKCNGPIWDNRAKNAQDAAGGNANASKRPDFKCRNKDGCGEGIWLKPKGR